jgi:transcriptional regulator with XRE-family HTH domain
MRRTFLGSKDIGNRIKELRANKNQTEFAEMIGIDQTTLSRYENGGKLNESTLFLLAERCNKTISWILTGKNEENSASTTYEQRGATGTHRGGQDPRVREIPSKYDHLPKRVKDLLDDVVVIMTSDDKGTQAALEQNVHTFLRTVKLQRDNDVLTKIVNPSDPPGNAKET